MVTNIARGVLLALITIVAPVASARQSGELDPVTQAAVERAPAMLEQARAACVNPARHQTLSGHQIEDAIRDTLGQIELQVQSPADIPKADALLAGLESKIGELDTMPSLDLQLMLATLAGIAEDTPRRIDRRAFNMALMLAISQSGDGTTPATAIDPCMLGNEHYFARTALKGALGQQRLEEHGGRYYDAQTLTTADGREQTVYFDIHALFKSQGKTLKETPDQGDRAKD